MIEINLLPQELQVKLKKKARSARSKQILYIIPFIFAILVIIHIYLTTIILAKEVHLASLNNKWQKLTPQRKMLEDFKKEFEGITKDSGMLQKIFSQRLTWAEKLNKLSLDLPSGIWFREIVATARDFNLKASAVSLQKDEMNMINKFINNLEKDQVFFKDFKSMELTSVQAKVIGGYEVTEFALSATLKSQ